MVVNKYLIKNRLILVLFLLAKFFMYKITITLIIYTIIQSVVFFMTFLISQVTINKEIEKKVLIALLKAQKRLRDAPKVIIGKVELICPKCGTPLKLIYVKRLEESERERIMDLRQTKAPPPIKLDPKQDKNG